MKKLENKVAIGLPIIDTRKPDTTGQVSIPGSRNIPYDELVGRMDELDKNYPSIFFCNGPQCPQIINSNKEPLKRRLSSRKTFILQRRNA